jgi:hypothetical protein
MKKLPILLLLGISFITYTPSVASPFLQIGDHGDLFVLTDAGLSFTSNVTLDEVDAQSDFIFTLSPGLELALGRGLTQTNAAITARIDIVRYADLSEFDNENLNLGSFLSHEGPRLKLDANASYREFQQNQEDINLFRTLLNLREFRAGIGGEYDLGERTSLGAGLNFSDVRYKNADFAQDRKVFSLPLDLFYDLTPKLDLSVGYRFRNTDIGARPFDGTPGNDSKDHFLNVGFRGELAPALTGRLQVGYLTRDFDRGSSESTIALISSFDYQLSAKTQLRLSLDRDFDAAGTGESTERTGITGSFTHSVSPQMFINGSAGYRLTDFRGAREDKNARFSLGTQYFLYNFLSLGANYAFVDNNSNVNGLSFTNHTVSFSASLRY